MIVVIKNGRLAGKKAVVLAELEDNMLLLGGINRLPTPTEDHMATWQKRKAEKFLTFIKKSNMKHVLATRYKADVDFSTVTFEDENLDINTKSATNQKINHILKEAYEAKKAKFLFAPLRF